MGIITRLAGPPALRRTLPTRRDALQAVGDAHEFAVQVHGAVGVGVGLGAFEIASAGALPILVAGGFRFSTHDTVLRAGRESGVMFRFVSLPA